MKTRCSIRIAAASLSTMAMLWAPLAAHAGEVAGGVIGCDASGKKQEGGALVGAVLGGVAGNNLARNDRRAGTLIGATAGAAAGSYIGCNMQKSDAAKSAASAPVQERPVAVDEQAPARVQAAEPQDRRAVPPGLAKKPHGMPPGQAKKYAIGDRLPGTYVREPRYYVSEPERYRLRYPPTGYRWVIVERDAYLVRTRTGVIADVARAIVG